jgi:branched-chain amino acid transport system permease protein
MAIRDDEIAAEAMGVPTTRLKVLAFASGAAWAGVAGVCFAGKFAFVSPESFTFFESIVILAMVVLGGMSSIPGVVLGAVVIVVVPELLRGVQDYRMLLFGAALVLMMALRPEGLIRRGLPRRRLGAAA